MSLSAPVRDEMDEQIKHMVDRFLMWRLPENFHPDNGISFKPTFNDHLPEPMKHNPVGTNLFDADQVDAMVRHMLEGLPANTRTPASQVEAGEVERRYHELLFAVGTKHGGENRHETALRYIREREVSAEAPAAQSRKEQP